MLCLITAEATTAPHEIITPQPMAESAKPSRI